MKIKKFTTGRFSQNGFVYYDANKALVIDPGENPEVYLSFLEKNNLDVLAVLLTHGHFDHIFGVNKILAKFPNADLYAHRNEKEFLINPNYNLSCNLEEICIIEKEPILVENNDVLKIGNFVIKVLSFPGHTEGSVVFLSESDNIAFVGDFIFKGDIGRMDLIGSDHVKMDKSLLLALQIFNDDLFLYCGHGEDTIFSDEKKYNPYLKKILNRI